MADTNSSMGITYPSTFAPTVTYTIKEPQNEVLAKFSGILAKCGNCGYGLGEFLRVEGKIICKRGGCRTMNIVKK